MELNKNADLIEVSVYVFYLIKLLFLVLLPIYDDEFQILQALQNSCKNCDKMYQGNSCNGSKCLFEKSNKSKI